MTESSRVALVTGASGGIGAGIAERLAEDGWSVAVHGYSNDREALRVRDRIRAYGRNAQSFLADLADEDAVSRLFEEIMGEFGRLDAAVANAGIFPRSLVVEMSTQEWSHVLDVNLKSTFLVCRAAARHLLSQGRGGRIVTIASGAASRGIVRGAHYAASKAGIVGFTKTLALELAAHNVLVNCVAPGTVDTRMPRQANTEEELVERARRMVPLGRMGQPRDVAEVVAFLLDDRVTWITGQTLWVNGGDLMP